MGWSDEKGERRGAGSEFDEANVPFFEVGAENFHRLIRENFADLLIRFFPTSIANFTFLRFILGIEASIADFRNASTTM